MERLMNSLIQPLPIMLFGVVMFFVFLAMSKTGKRP
jgi:hypothetical protein